MSELKLEHVTLRVGDDGELVISTDLKPCGSTIERYIYAYEIDRVIALVTAREPSPDMCMNCCLDLDKCSCMEEE